jgi:RNA polymerase sigma factor (sigma-70 family)
VGINHCRRAKRPEYLEEVVAQPVTFQTDPFGMEEVVEALQQLPPRQRAVFNMLEVEGLDETEVAEKMSTPVTNVRTLMSRAKGRLKELLTR